MGDGFFISFEGVDGSGKSTQARLLASALRGQGADVLLTREPGGSPGAEDIRKLLLEGEADRWSPEVELLLFTAARLEHLQKLIRPALALGQMVICDRFADSTRVYQGIARQDLMNAVETLHNLLIVQEPDITFLIDIEPAEGMRRSLARAGAEMRFEEMGLDMMTRVREGFLHLAAQNPQRFCVIDGRGSAPAVARLIRDALQERI